MTKFEFLSTIVAVGLALSLAYRSDTAIAKQSQIEAEAQSERDSTASMNSEGVSAKTYVVEEGDTLGEIAKQFLGNEKKWRVIAQANQISDPSKLEVGTRLAIPADSADLKSHGKTAPAPGRESDKAEKPEESRR